MSVCKLCGAVHRGAGYACRDCERVRRELAERAREDTDPGAMRVTLGDAVRATRIARRRRGRR